MTILLEELNAKGKCTLPIGTARTGQFWESAGPFPAQAGSACAAPSSSLLVCAWSWGCLRQPCPTWLQGMGRMGLWAANTLFCVTLWCPGTDGCKLLREHWFPWRLGLFSGR